MTKLLKAIICATALLSAVQFSYGQGRRTVSGTVLDTNGEPVVGAAVMAGPGTGTVTDIDGSFSLQVKDSDVTLDVTCLSYTDKTIVVAKDQVSVTVILEEDTMMLQETVVVGYGVQKKVNLTGAISTVTSKDLDNRTASTLTHMLQGAVPGLRVTTASGQPVDEPTINIRGVNSINGGNPLVLIDGVEGSLTKVNPKDVESVSVIKDASSSAIYGARASFGVILVTTKNGSNTDGKPVVRYSAHGGVSTSTTSTDYIDTGYWSVYICDLFSRGTTNANWTKYTEDDMQELWARVNDKTENPERPWVLIENRGGRDQWIYYANTDWYETLYTNRNNIQQHNISISGGSESMKYYFSLGYEHKSGNFRTRPDSYNKFNVLAKLEFKLNKWLDFSNNISAYRSLYDWPGNGSPNYTYAYGAVAGLASIPPYNPDGTFVYKVPSVISANILNGCHIELLDDTKVNTLTKYNLSNTSELTAHIIKGLDVKANVTYRVSDDKKLNRWTIAYYSPYPGVIATDEQGRFENKLDTNDTISEYVAANLYANYATEIADGHHLSAVAGLNYETEHIKYQASSGKNLSSQYLTDFKLVQPNSEGVKVWNIDSYQNQYAIGGIFGRINYDYKEKYLFEASGRYDGTSRFDAAHRWGFFPSASVGWKFSEEDFMKNLDWLNIGKLRFSYGALGNQQVGYYEFIRTMNLGNASYIFNDPQYASTASLTAPNAGDLTWEVAHHYNLGLDIAALQNRLTFTGEAYIRDTKGMLTSNENLPAVYGAPSPLKNGANLRSKGYELTVGWRDSFKLAGHPFNYSINATLADYISVITKFQNPSRLMGTYYEGMVMGEIWGYRTDGLFRTDEEAAEWTKQHDQSKMATNLNGGWLAGDVKYLDLDNDGEVGIGSYTIDEPGDMRIIGNENPRYQYGLTMNAEYRGFDFSIFFQGIGHQDWYPPTYSHSFWFCYNQCCQTYVPKDFLSKVWSEDNLDAYFPRPRCNIGNQGGTEITTVNDRYLINIAYCRLKNLTIGYTIPEKTMNKLPFSNIRVYFTGENLAYLSPLKKITKYMDPEQCFIAAQHGFTYPWQKSFICGIDITF